MFTTFFFGWAKLLTDAEPGPLVSVSHLTCVVVDLLLIQFSLFSFVLICCQIMKRQSCLYSINKNSLKQKEKRK